MGDSKLENGESGSKDEPESLRKLFVGKLPTSVAEEKLKEFYSQFGEVTEVILVKESGTEKSRGFGFVTFDSMGSVDIAMANRPHNLEGKELDAKRAVPKERSGQPEAQMQVKKLFVGGIKDDHTEEQLKDYFSEYGTVETVDIISDKDSNKRRGFAFVVFDDFDPVDKCCLIKMHDVGGHKCDVKKALSRDEQRKVAERKREMAFRGDRMGGGFGGGRGGGRGGFGGAEWGGYGPWGGGGGYGGGYDGGYGGGFGGGRGGYGGGGWGGAPAWGGGGYGGGGQWGQGGGGYGGGGYGFRR